MTNQEKKITKETSFYSKKTISSISKYKKCLDKFSKNFEKEISLETKSPIFLDTNVLLRYYSISFTARAKLFEFLKKHSDRIIITSQVQYEFLKNREDIIQRFFEQVTSKIPKDFNTDIVNKMKNFLDNHKVVLKDYSFVEPGIIKHQTELEELQKNLNTAVEANTNKHNDLLIKDEFLDFLASCEECPSLTDDEVKLIQVDFEVLSKNLTSETVDSFLNNPNNAFPGCGDIKGKPEDPFGDYIIYHEMMRYILNNDVDAVFMTFDNTKGDWMGKNKSPLLQYAQNIYANTGKLLYIVDAERTLGKLLDVDINSLVSVNTPKDSMRPITSDAINEFIVNCNLYSGEQLKEIPEHTLRELRINGYQSMQEVESDIKKHEYGIKKYLKDNLGLSTIGTIRASLRVANPKYTTQINSRNGEVSGVSESMLEEYRKYASLKEGD